MTPENVRQFGRIWFGANKQRYFLRYLWHILQYQYHTQHQYLCSKFSIQAPYLNLDGTESPFTPCPTERRRIQKALASNEVGLPTVSRGHLGTLQLS